MQGMRVVACKKTGWRGARKGSMSLSGSLGWVGRAVGERQALPPLAKAVTAQLNNLWWRRRVLSLSGSLKPLKNHLALRTSEAYPIRIRKMHRVSSLWNPEGALLPPSSFPGLCNAKCNQHTLGFYLVRDFFSKMFWRSIKLLMELAVVIPKAVVCLLLLCES